MELIGTARSIRIPVRAVSRAPFKISVKKPISLHTGPLCFLGSISPFPLLRHPRVLPPLFSMDSNLLPVQPVVTARHQRFAQAGEAEGAARVAQVHWVVPPSPLNPSPLIDISGWEADSHRRSFDIKGVFTPPLHQSKLKLICAYTLLLK